MSIKNTVASCIRIVLKEYPKGLTANEIYNKIIEKNLYVFGAKNPRDVVRQEIRRHCVDVKIYTAYPIKYFKIVGKSGNELLYNLIDDKNATTIEPTPIIDEDATI